MEFIHHDNKLVFSLFCFFFFLYMFGDHETVMSQNTTTTEEFHVGVVLDMDSLVAKMGLTSMSIALSDFYSSPNTSHKRRLVLHTRDSKRDNVDAVSAAIDLMKNLEVQAIIGPTTSSQANFMVDLGNKAHVPIISFTATSPSISPSKNPYFIRTAQNDSSQVNVIAAIVKAFGWREVVVIYEDTEYGNGVIPYIMDAFQEIDTRVPYRSVLSTSATDDRILVELYKLMTMQTRVFVVHMTQSLGRRVFEQAKMIGMMTEGYSWIITDGLAYFLNSFDYSSIDSMQGVLGVKPYIPMSEELDKFRVRWRKKFQQDHPDDIEKADLNVIALWAYDTIWALASAVEKLESMNPRFLKPKVAPNLSDIEKLGVSQIGHNLMLEISKIKFKGLSGEFNLISGQLQSKDFQIINVVDHGAGREIGFWTQSGGIVRDINSIGSTGTGVYSTNKTKLRSIIWPGDTTFVPKGWVIPTNGKKLRIGVPVKKGFTEFVKVRRSPGNISKSEVTGYCIDVFEAVRKKLPYALPYEFIPFPIGNDTFTESYDDLIMQVYKQNFDAVVGDVTIRANRSKYVDFTLPYTESGVSMIVLLEKADRRYQGWIFLKPLKLELWLITPLCFVFIGFVIWVLEHKVNEEFRGPRSYQVGTSLWFSFSTLVFAHKEKLVSNYSRFVVIIWVFVVLVLTQSYTASLASILTVQRLKPSVTDVQQLINNGDKVGYQEGSFVRNLLLDMGFKAPNLRTFSSAKEFDEAFSNANKSDRIVAAFEETPFIKLLMATYSGKYTQVGRPINKTDGFGFVFPSGSPLLQDFSRSILRVTEGREMTMIEQYWLGNNTYPDPNPDVSSSSLGFENFWGLFVIAAVCSILPLLIFMCTFLYKKRKIFTSDNPDSSISQKIIQLTRHYDEKDLSSHTFRNYRLQDGTNNIQNTDKYVPANFLRSLSLRLPRISYQTDGNDSIMEYQSMSADDGGVGNSNPEITPAEERPTVEQTRHQVNQA